MAKKSKRSKSKAQPKGSKVQTLRVAPGTKPVATSAPSATKKL